MNTVVLKAQRSAHFSHSTASFWRAIGRSTALTAIVFLAVTLVCTRSAKADSLLASYSFSGAVNGDNYYGSTPQFLTNAGVQTGDTIGITFDLYNVYSPNGSVYQNGVRNIVVTDLTRDSTITTIAMADLLLSQGENSYRFDAIVPGDNSFVLDFWLRSSTPGLVKVGQLPTSIDVSKFDFTHDVSFYYAPTHATVLDARLVSTVAPTPEPSAWLLLATGLLFVGFVVRQR